MLFDFAGMAGADTYKLLASTIVPRPIAWITSVDAAGTVNAAPFSFFNVLSGDPPVVAIGIGGRPGGERKDSGHNIALTGQFVVNLVSAGLAEKMNITAVEFPPGVSEIAEAGLTLAGSARVRPPRLAESPVSLECERMQAIDLGPGRAIVLGRVLAVHVRDDAVLSAERHYIDTPKLDLIGRMHGGGWYARTTDRFEMPRIPLKDWKKDAG